MVPARFVVSVFVFVAPLVFRAPSDPAVGPGCWLCPWAAARPRAVRAASFARRVVSKPGQAPPPPTGTAARPSAPSGALHTGGTWCAGVWPGQDPPPLTGAVARPRHRPRALQPGPAAAHGRCSQARFEARPCPPDPPAPSTPAVPVVLVCPARTRRHSRVPQPGSLFSLAPSTPAVPVVLVCPARPRHRPRASPLMLTNFARNSPTTVSNLECASLELQRFQRLLKLPSNELRATFLEPAVSYVLHQRIQECSVFRGPTVPRGCAWFGHSWGVRTSL